MELFCTDAERNRCRKREKGFALAFRILLGAAAAAFILVCLLIRTENAKAMHAVLIAVTAVFGWACIAVYLFGVKETRAEGAHLDMLRTAEPAVREGRMSLEDGAIRIPKSIRIRKLILDTGAGEPERLNIDESRVPRLPPDGSLVRLSLAGSYVAGLEVLNRADGSARKLPKGAALRRKAGRLVPLLGAWALAAVFLSSFVFYQIRDAEPARKITVYMDGTVANEDALAARLEKELGGAVKLVEIRPFSYFMFGSDILRAGDLFILPDSALEQFGDWILPGDGGIPVYDPASGVSVEGGTFLYAQGERPETWRLYLGAQSPHLEDGLARKAAGILAAEKEETE